MLASSLPARLSIAPRRTQIVSALDQFAELGELLRPADAAHDALGVFQVEHGVAAGAPGLGFLVCECLIEAIMPPSITSARFFKAAASTVVCEQ